MTEKRFWVQGTGLSGTGITRRKLYRLVWEQPLTSVAKELGMSAGGLGKICDRLDIPYPPRGYWARRRAGRAPETPPLPPKPSDAAEKIQITGGRERSRRTRLRKTPEVRRAELKSAAREMIIKGGLHQTTMKLLASKIGISEALAHNYYTRDQLLIELTRDELKEIESARQTAMSKLEKLEERAIVGTQVYLEEISKRGSLIQDLLALPVVRDALRKERKSKSEAGVLRATTRLGKQHKVPEAVARGTTQILTAVSLRAGNAISSGLVDLETAERLTLAIVAAGNEAVIATWSPNAADRSA